MLDGGEVSFKLLQKHQTAWQPGQTRVTANVRCDARIVPSASDKGARVSYSHVVVLDQFFDEPTRSGLLDLLTSPGWDHTQVSRRLAECAANCAFSLRMLVPCISCHDATFRSWDALARQFVPSAPHPVDMLVCRAPQRASGNVRQQMRQG